MTAGRPIREAASVIVLREGGAQPQVLMGRRGATAAFMPAKYVFPGGALDPEDGPPGPEALWRCAARELFEETGLALDPRASLDVVFRAITPPGRPRRFDTRFVVVRAADGLAGDPDDFSRAGDELADLRWVTIAQARTLDLPFITEVVLAEVAERAAKGDFSGPVPVFDNRTDQSQFFIEPPLRICSNNVAIAIDEGNPAP